MRSGQTPGLRFFEQLRQDFRLGGRVLVRNPGFTAAAVLSLALGLGAVTAVFSVFDALWLRPFPYQHTERLVAVSEVSLDAPEENWPVSVANYFDWKAQSRSFEYLTLIHPYWDQILIGGDHPEQVTVERVTPGFFEIFGGQAVYGRLFLPGEYEKGATPVAVLGYRLWRRLFGSDPGVLGKRFSMETSMFSIVGVLSPEFNSIYPLADLWTPITSRTANRRARYFRVMGRLRPGGTIASAQAEMDVIARRLATESPDQKGFGARVEPLRGYMYGYWKTRFLVLFGAVVLVLSIACMNVAGLILVRLCSRQKEMAVRASLGAGPPRLIRQLLTENLLIIGFGVAVAVPIAFVAVKLMAGTDPNTLPQAAALRINLPVLGFAVLTAALSGLITGLAPAVSVSRPNLNESLKEVARAAPSRGASRGRSTLIILEIGLSLVLLTGAGLMIHDIRRLLRLDLGFDSSNLVMMRISLPTSQYVVDDGKLRTLKPRAALVRQGILEGLRALPGVRSVSVAKESPLEGCSAVYVSVGREPFPTIGANTPWSCLLPVSTEFFRTLQVPVVKGRPFEEHDDRSDPPPVLVNQSLVRRYFPNGDPIGRTLNLMREDGDREPSVQIVGVVPDLRQSLLRRPYAAIYMPYSKMPARFRGAYTTDRTDIVYLVRAAAKPSSLQPDMRRAVSGVALDVAVTDLRTVDDIRSLRVERSRFYAWLLTVFAGIAATLASVGVFGVVSYAVGQRTREIGIRVALGATRRDVFTLVMQQGVLLVSLGIAVGLAGSLCVTRFLVSLLFEVKPIDPLTLTVMSFFLALVALVACLLPVWRALGVNPVTALRHE